MIKKILFILILSAAWIFSQSGSSYRFEHLTLEDGLSQNSIICMLQDSKGFMWFGTANGLNRYDGYEFKVFTNDPFDSSSISDNGISSVFEDESGNIWAGTIQGVLNKYERKSGKFTQFNVTDSVPYVVIQWDEYFEYPIRFSRNNNSTITSITKDSSGVLWIGTWGLGLIRFNPETKEKSFYYHNPIEETSISYNRILKVFVDGGNNKWIATFGGGLNRMYDLKESDIPKDEVFRVSDKGFYKYLNDSNNPKSINDDRISTIFEDVKGNLWLGTFRGGINIIERSQKYADPNEIDFIHITVNEPDGKALSSNSIMAIIQDKSDFIWAGTFGGGLNRITPDLLSVKQFLKDPLDNNSVADNEILSLWEDKSGIIWIGTHISAGVSKLIRNQVKFEHIKSDPADENSLSDDVIWSVYDDNSYIWAGTYRGGLNRINKKTGNFKVFRHNSTNPNSISDNHVRSIIPDYQNNLWIGTYSGGLNLFIRNTENFSKISFKRGELRNIGSNQIQALHIDSLNNIWIGTFGSGLNTFNLDDYYNNKRINLTSYLHNPYDTVSISDNRIYDIYEDNSGNLWIGTFGGGLNKLDRKQEKFTRYLNDPNDPYSISDNRITVIFQDSNGSLWIGTLGGSLNKYEKNNNRFIRFGREKGFISNVIYGILEDNSNNLWISSDRGIFKFNTINENITYYDVQDGLQSMEFSGGAYYKNNNGIMMFGGVNGFNMFHPDSISADTYIPPVLITSFSVFNNPMKGELNEVSLNYDQNFITIGFAALDYSHPKDIQYTYMLEGFNDKWTYSDAGDRTADFTRLPPGDYIFKVRATNSDGIWNNTGAELKLNILPPFWEKWWFVTLVLLLAGTAVTLIVVFRINHLIEIERLKTRLAADLHDNVGAGLTEISILSELSSHELNNDNSGISRNLHKISSTSRELVDSMSDIVWVVNPQRDSLKDLIIRLKDYYNDLMMQMGIAFKVQSTKNAENIKLPMDYKQHLYLIFKEGINNSIKHSRCSSILLNADMFSNNIEITLSDNGIGSDKDKIKYGNGLNNIKKRAKSIGGNVIWNSEPGKGTTIKFSGKIKSNIKLG